MTAMKRLSGGKNAQEQWVAYHEAGHAVAAIVVGIRLGEVSLTPDETARHRASTTVRLAPGSQQLIERGVLPPGQADRLACFCFAGDAAQCRFAPRSVRLHHKAFDVRAVLDILEQFPAHERSEHMMRARIRAKEIVESHWTQVEEVANMLLRKRKLGEPDIRRIVRRTRRGNGHTLAARDPFAGGSPFGHGEDPDLARHQEAEDIDFMPDPVNVRAGRLRYQDRW